MSLARSNLARFDRPAVEIVDFWLSCADQSGVFWGFETCLHVSPCVSSIPELTLIMSLSIMLLSSAYEDLDELAYSPVVPENT